MAFNNPGIDRLLPGFGPKSYFAKKTPQ